MVTSYEAVFLIRDAAYNTEVTTNEMEIARREPTGCAEVEEAA
jgi:hypothetical protein